MNSYDNFRNLDTYRNLDEKWWKSTYKFLIKSTEKYYKLLLKSTEERLQVKYRNLELYQSFIFIFLVLL
jgi:hypothetical protein